MALKLKTIEFNANGAAVTLAVPDLANIGKHRTSKLVLSHNTSILVNATGMSMEDQGDRLWFNWDQVVEAMRDHGRRYNAQGPLKAKRA